ncbi:hypothetical protein MUK70_19035 [Dyadobacter chenwenxiniae]|uniref:Uncharacterized protein n=1 Tax=Dyadobacter chenwenxiniae TaxID=2906456 RepID=A0A9X1PIJ2_9BACT|nr:hypothetical protein [Dyadobacter chenwenxiniae]MCF0061336.1 hypothetical protein [Dyadobacter chenwenxiniae]UON81158.1 hypothetical protein MUK70_19035 [Dyadobacter chenwenxiniae]
MALEGYHFIREIEKFNTDSYIPHLGWIATTITTLKIYSRFDSPFFYLHDEVQDRLSEFLTEDPKKLKSKQEYDKVMKAYHIFRGV